MAINHIILIFKRFEVGSVMTNFDKFNSFYINLILFKYLIIFTTNLLYALTLF